MDLQSVKRLIVGMTAVTFLGVSASNSCPAFAGWDATGNFLNDIALTSVEEASEDTYLEEDDDGDTDEAKSWADFEFTETYPGESSAQTFIHYRSREAPVWVTTITPVGDGGIARVTADFNDGTGVHSKFVGMGGVDNSALTLADAHEFSFTEHGLPNGTARKIEFPFKVEMTVHAFYDLNIGSNGVAYAQAQVKSASKGVAKN